MPDLEARRYVPLVGNQTVHYFKSRSKWSLCRHILRAKTYKVRKHWQSSLWTYNVCRTCIIVQETQGFDNPLEEDTSDVHTKPNESR